MLLEDLTIDFSSYFITSIIDVYRDKLIFFLWLSCGSFAIFLSLFLILPITPSWVPSAQLIFGRVRPNFDWSGREWRQPILQPLLFLPTLLFLLWVVVWPSRPSWRSFSVWMLALTLSVMSCVRWTPSVLHDDRLALVVSPLLLLLLLLRRLQRIRMVMMVMTMLMRMRMLALLVMIRWWPLDDLPFVIRDKKGE